MASTVIKTRSDVVDHLMDWAGTSSAEPETLRRVQRAIEAAYREIPALHNWSYFYGRRRLDTVADYDTGTIAYTNSTRTVTLTSGTWPSWARFGILQISGVDYEVVTRSSDSVLILSVNNHPPADIAAGTSYKIYRDDYPLPVDFLSLGSIRNAETGIFLQYFEPNDINCREINTSPSEPVRYTIMRDQNYVGALGITLYPPPDDIYQYDYIYRRRPRQFTTYKYNTGTVTTSGTTLTGTGTAWTANMVGTVVRFGSATALPSGTHGSNPFVAHRMIASFSSATSLSMDQALDSELASVKYELSDPIEMEAGAMYTAFLRRAEYELATMQRRDDAAKLYQQARESLLTAMEEDNRVFDRKPSPTRGNLLVPTYFTISEP